MVLYGIMPEFFEGSQNAAMMEFPKTGYKHPLL